MKLRRQLPVWSPLPRRALVAGAGALLGAGEPLRDVRRLIDARYHPEDALLVDSGTSALALAMCAAGKSAPSIGSDRDWCGEVPARIALPAWGCYDLATAADMAGARVRLYDLDPATLGPDQSSLAGVLDEGVDGVVVVHYFGMAADILNIREQAAARDVLLIEDAAQAVGGSLAGQPLGVFGSLAVLSFGRGKGLTGSGGGALLAGDAKGAARLDRVRRLVAPSGKGSNALARAAAQWMLARPRVYGIPASLPFLKLGETPYHHPHPVETMAPAQAGILRETWPEMEAEATRRRSNVRALMPAIEQSGFTAVRPLQRAEPGWLRLPVLAPKGARFQLDPDGERLGVMPGYPLPLHRLPGFMRLEDGGPWHGAEEICARLFTLPVHGKLEPRDLDALRSWLAKRGRMAA